MERRQNIAPGTAFSNLLDLQVTVKGSSSSVAPISNLEDIGLDSQIYMNVKNVLKQLTPIQRYTIPSIIRGYNVMACSHTGSGKTAGFMLPILHQFLKNFENTKQTNGLPAKPKVLVVVPTRELAKQVLDETIKMSSNSRITRDSIHLVTGGTNFDGERKRLMSFPCNIVIGTVGRLLHIIDEKQIVLDEVKYFVLDEADEMMKIGFYFQILDLAKMCRDDKISLMFSATYPNIVKNAADSILGSNYLEITAGEIGATASLTIQQEFELVESADKNYALQNVLRSEDPTKLRAIVFVGKIENISTVKEFIESSGYTVALLHSELESQKDRNLALKLFDLGKVQILLATSIAGRGLDIPNVSLVINYDLPTNIEEYILRIGRTGRVGNVGRSVSFFEAARDGPLAENLISTLSRTDQAIPDWMKRIKNEQSEEIERLKFLYDMSPFSNAKPIFNSLGRGISGIPLPVDIPDNDWSV